MNLLIPTHKYQKSLTLDISNSLINISILTYQLTDESNSSASASFQSVSFKALLGKINALIYDVVIGEELQSGTLREDRDLLQSLGDDVVFVNPDKAQAHITQFVSDINTILDNYKESREKFSALNSLESAQLLNAIEDEYTNYHNKGITKSNQFNTALIIYGSLLLLALLLFAWEIRKNYLYSNGCWCCA